MDFTVGQKLDVFDKQDGNLIGKFEISEIRETEFFAKATGYVNPVWLGYYNKNPNGGEYSSPPNTTVILATREEAHE